MARLAVVNAVKARLGATWNGLPVIAPNDAMSETPADGSAFIALEFPVSNTERLPVNQRRYQEEGGFRIVINGERGAGVDDILTLADQVAALFCDQSFDGVRTQAPTSPRIDDGNDEGNYFRVVVAVPYTFQFDQ